jgi:signal transduction histidine kinase
VETAQRAIDPFFSGREAGRGIGLGLSKAWRLIDTNGGVLEIDSKPGRGTCVTIRVPRTSQPMAPAAR